ncbi:MAG: DUF2442 domain-containing protein [Candidatus Riflebacteria bacterium]
MDKIVKVIPLKDFRLEILTSSGISGVFNVEPYLGGSAFHELRNLDYFRQVKPAHHGIRWPNGQDFSSDTVIHDLQRSSIDSKCA